MEMIKQAVHMALRDDATATIGLRTLLGHSGTPYGVYAGHFPEAADFSSKSYLTWMLVSSTPEDDTHGVDVRRSQALFSVTAWSESRTTMDRILRRARNVLVDMRKLTLPTSESEVHAIKFDGAGPDLFDDDWKVHYRAEHYRVWYRDDITN